MINKNTTGVVKIANESTSIIYQIENYNIKDEVLNEVKLQGRRIVEGATHPITFLTRLMKEGHNMGSGRKKLQRFTRMVKN